MKPADIVSLCHVPMPHSVVSAQIAAASWFRVPVVPPTILPQQSESTTPPVAKGHAMSLRSPWPSGAIAYAKVSQNFILELPRPNLAKHRTLGIKPLEPLILNVESLISLNTIRLQRVGSASRLGTGPVVRDLIV